MKTFVQPGNAVSIPAPAGGVVSGRAYVIGALAGVAAVSAAAGETFALNVTGVYALPAKAGAAFAVGDVAYLDNADGTVTDASAPGLFPVGVYVGEDARGAAIRFDGISVKAVA